jgi:hypothetical protein
MNITAPSRDIIRKRHVGFLTRFKRQRGTVIKQRMRAGMDGKTVEQPIAIGSVANETRDKWMRGSKTGSDFAFETGNNEVGKGGLNFQLDVTREEGEPNAKRIVGAKGMKGRDKATIVLAVQDNTIPPGGEIAKSIGIKSRKQLLELLLLFSVEATIGQVGKEKGAIHVNSVQANRMMDKNTMIGARSNPRNNRASVGINNHVGGIMDVTLEILPGGALTKGRVTGGTVCKERLQTDRERETGTLVGVPGRISSSRGRRG